MSDDTQPIQAVSLPGGQEVYDMIMAGIEPELTSAQIEGLDAKYAGETEEENAARVQRYKSAFAEYQKKYEEYRKAKQQEVMQGAKQMQRTVEHEVSSLEEHELSNLSDAIANA